MVLREQRETDGQLDLSYCEDFTCGMVKHVSTPGHVYNIRTEEVDWSCEYVTSRDCRKNHNLGRLICYQ